MATGTSSTSTASSSGHRGRPRSSVSREQLSLLRSLRFTWSAISSITDVSVSTLQRRAQEWGITTYCDIATSDLQETVVQLLQRFPNSGEVMLRGHLESQGIVVPRWRLREALVHIRGHLAVAPPIHRRTYSVPGPNHLWHIDGNHKLIRWRLVIHGGIDGFSRLATYLVCANNNRAETVLDCFCQAAEEYRVPSRVRSDFGGENTRV